jgi:hypothetical protein
MTKAKETLQDYFERSCAVGERFRGVVGRDEKGSVVRTYTVTGEELAHVRISFIHGGERVTQWVSAYDHSGDLHRGKSKLVETAESSAA